MVYTRALKGNMVTGQTFRRRGHLLSVIPARDRSTRVENRTPWTIIDLAGSE